jgi:hypothetical protein
MRNGAPCCFACLAASATKICPSLTTRLGFPGFPVPDFSGIPDFAIPISRGHRRESQEIKYGSFHLKRTYKYRDFSIMYVVCSFFYDDS